MSMRNDQSSGNHPETVTTSSRLRMIWMTRFQGYRIDTVRRSPKESTFGEIYYKNLWVLVKRGQSGD